jgi:hypothetical protein
MGPKRGLEKKKAAAPATSPTALASSAAMTSSSAKPPERAGCAQTAPSNRTALAPLFVYEHPDLCSECSRKHTRGVRDWMVQRSAGVRELGHQSLDHPRADVRECLADGSFIHHVGVGTDRAWVEGNGPRSV